MSWARFLMGSVDAMIVPAERCCGFVSSAPARRVWSTSAASVGLTFLKVTSSLSTKANTCFAESAFSGDRAARCAVAPTISPASRT